MRKRKKPADSEAGSKQQWTLSVPEAGAKYFGLSRNGSYDAAGRGEIPTVKIGRLLRVPVQALETQLQGVRAKLRSHAA